MFRAVAHRYHQQRFEADRLVGFAWSARQGIVAQMQTDCHPNYIQMVYSQGALVVANAEDSLDLTPVR